MDAALRRAITRHGNSRLARGTRATLYEFEECLGIGDAIANRRYRRVVTGLFCQPHDLPVEIPAQRAEPQHGAM